MSRVRPSWAVHGLSVSRRPRQLRLEVADMPVVQIDLGVGIRMQYINLWIYIHIYIYLSLSLSRSLWIGTLYISIYMHTYINT